MTWPKSWSQYNILQRDAEANKQLYDGLLQKLKEARISAGLAIQQYSRGGPGARSHHSFAAAEGAEYSARVSGRAWSAGSGWRSSASISTTRSNLRTTSKR